MTNPEFDQLIEQIKAIHASKSHDYSAFGPYENFERASLVSSWFNDPHDKVFTTFIATKLTRLATLLNSSESPKNESIEDSFLDLVTYCALWASWRKSSKNITKLEYIYITDGTFHKMNEPCDCNMCRKLDPSKTIKITNPV